jgi:glycosyltransferase involved in cell wall biosynthesis
VGLKMKIIHVIDYFQPQLGYQETFLAKEQAKQGHEVYVLTSDRYNPIVYKGNAAKKILGSRIKGTGFFVEEGINVWRLKTVFELPHAIWMLGIEEKIKEINPDVIHIHGIANLAAIRVALLKRKKSDVFLVFDDHMLFIASRSPLKCLYPIFKWTFAKLIFGQADALVGVEDSCKDFMHKNYGFPLEDIKVIPLGADDSLFKRDLKIRKVLREKYCFEESDVVFIYAGKIIPEKGPHILVEAACKLMKEYDNVKVLLVGNGRSEYIQRIQKIIVTNNLEDRFILHNAVPNKDLFKLYSTADVAVWPMEASLSMMEAMSCELPVIISDNSEVKKRVQHDNGFTYTYKNPDSLAEKMELLLNPQKRADMGANGRRYIKEHLSWKVISGQFIDLIREC